MVVAGEERLPQIRISRQHGRPQKCIQASRGRQEVRKRQDGQVQTHRLRLPLAGDGLGWWKHKSHGRVDVNGRYGRRKEGRWGRGREEVRPQTSAHPRLARKSKGTQQRLIHTIRPQRTGMCLRALLISNASPFFRGMPQQLRRLVLPRPAMPLYHVSPRAWAPSRAAVWCRPTQLRHVLAHVHDGALARRAHGGSSLATATHAE